MKRVSTYWILFIVFLFVLSILVAPCYAQDTIVATKEAIQTQDLFNMSPLIMVIYLIVKGGLVVTVNLSSEDRRLLQDIGENTKRLMEKEK